MSCPCNDKPKKHTKQTANNYRKDWQSRATTYQTQSTISRNNICPIQNKYQTKNSYLNNENVYLDDFLKSFAINNEYDSETGITRTHGIPSAFLDWCPKDTKKEYTHPKNSNIKWEIKNGYLIVRDYNIKGDRDLCVEEGGQIVVQRYYGIPLCALPSGYPASYLQGLGDFLTQFFDNDTIKKDPTKNNKFVANVPKQAMPEFYIDKDKTKPLFKYDEEGNFYYLVAGSLDNLVAVKTDNTTITGNGKDVPLKAN